MADDAAFSGPKEKGPPKWLMIGGAVAGVLGLVVLVTRNSGGSTGSTTAAGTSINAALGSLQEEQMNLLGTVQAGAVANQNNFASTQGQIADSTASILQAIKDQGTASQAALTGAVNTINANTNSSNQGMMAQLTDLFNKVFADQSNLLSMVQSTNQNVTTSAATINSNIATTQQDMLAQMSQIQALVNQGQNISGEQYNQLVAIATNPWVHNFYTALQTQGLDDYTRQQFYNLAYAQESGQAGSLQEWTAGIQNAISPN